MDEEAVFCNVVLFKGLSRALFIGTLTSCVTGCFPERKSGNCKDQIIAEVRTVVPHCEGSPPPSQMFMQCNEQWQRVPRGAAW